MNIWVRLHMQTYLFGDITVLINIIQIKGPVELLGDWPPEQHRQSYDEILEADWSVSVDVKRVEQEVSVRGCICGQNDMINQKKALRSVLYASQIIIYSLYLQQKRKKLISLFCFSNNVEMWDQRNLN